jgi:hypothetical protein
MILIQNDKIEDIKLRHYESIQPYALSMLNYYLAFFDAVGNGGFSVPDLHGKIPVLESRHHSTLTASSEILFDLKDGKLKVTKEILKEVLLHGKSATIDLNITSSQAKTIFKLFGEIKKRLDTIIIGSAMELQDIIDNAGFHFPQKSIELSCINWVFYYGKLGKDGYKLKDGKWTTYTLTSELGLSVCPYCNRNWIVTVTDENVPGTTKKIVNPQLDHFFSQEEQPQFAVSFYNLIPSCEACNARIKKRIQFNFNDYIHPYVNCYGNDSKFEAMPTDLDSQQGKGNNFKVSLAHNKNIDKKLKSKIEKSHTTFQIENIYEQHGDIIADLYKKNTCIAMTTLMCYRRV